MKETKMNNEKQCREAFFTWAESKTLDETHGHVAYRAWQTAWNAALNAQPLDHYQRLADTVRQVDGNIAELRQRYVQQAQPALDAYCIRKIEEALNPTGMRLNDGKARIDIGILSRLYKLAQQAHPADDVMRAIKNVPAFNMNGYDDDDVRRLHDWAVSLVHLADAQPAQPAVEPKGFRVRVDPDTGEHLPYFDAQQAQPVEGSRFGSPELCDMILKDVQQKHS